MIGGAGGAAEAINRCHGGRKMKKGDGGVVRKVTMHVTISLRNEEGGTE